MKKEEIFEIEEHNFDRINLFLEGTFWKAYEKSAFHFTKSYLEFIAEVNNNIQKMAMKVQITMKIRDIKSRLRLFAPLLLSLLLVCGCTKELEPELTTHTVICYLGGDNNLSFSIQSQIEELKAGYTSCVAAKVFVYAALPSGASLVQLRVGAEPQIIAQYDSGRSAEPAMLAQVIETCRRVAPAKSYTLIVASHASGWLPEGALSNPQYRPLVRSIIHDQQATPHEMELDDFAAAIPDGVFDAIVLESCLMGGVEVAYALRDKARYLLAAPAELLDPGFTPIYRNALRTLCTNKIDVRARLIAFAQQYMAYINPQAGNHRSATLSVIDLAHMEPLSEVFTRIVGQLPIASQQQLATVQHLDRPGQYGDKPALARFFDLQDAALQLTLNTASQQSSGAIELAAAIDRAVVWKQATPTFMPSLGGFVIEHFCGLTTYIPQPELPTLNNAYRASAWWQRTSGNDNLLRVETKRKIIAQTKAKKDYNLTNDIP